MIHGRVHVLSHRFLALPAAGYEPISSENLT